jgi:hypothetical protein
VQLLRLDGSMLVVLPPQPLTDGDWERIRRTAVYLGQILIAGIAAAYASFNLCKLLPGAWFATSFGACMLVRYHCSRSRFMPRLALRRGFSRSRPAPECGLLPCLLGAVDGHCFANPRTPPLVSRATPPMRHTRLPESRTNLVAAAHGGYTAEHAVA